MYSPIYLSYLLVYSLIPLTLNFQQKFLLSTTDFKRILIYRINNFNLIVHIILTHFLTSRISINLHWSHKTKEKKSGRENEAWKKNWQIQRLKNKRFFFSNLFGVFSLFRENIFGVF